MLPRCYQDRREVYRSYHRGSLSGVNTAMIRTKHQSTFRLVPGLSFATNRREPEECGSPKSKTPPLSTCDPCNYGSALSIHIWAESREVSASDWAGRNQIGDAVSPGPRRKSDREGDSWPATISGGDHVAVMKSAESRQRDDLALARRAPTPQLDRRACLSPVQYESGLRGNSECILSAIF